MKILSYHLSKECITTKQFKGSCPFPISMMVSTGEIYENLRIGTEVGNWIKKVSRNETWTERGEHFRT